MPKRRSRPAAVASQDPEQEVQAQGQPQYPKLAPVSRLRSLMSVRKDGVPQNKKQVRVAPVRSLQRGEEAIPVHDGEPFSLEQGAHLPSLRTQSGAENGVPERAHLPVKVQAAYSRRPQSSEPEVGSPGPEFVTPGLPHAPGQENGFTSRSLEHVVQPVRSQARGRVVRQPVCSSSFSSSSGLVTVAPSLSCTSGRENGVIARPQPRIRRGRVYPVAYGPGYDTRVRHNQAPATSQRRHRPFEMEKLMTFYPERQSESPELVELPTPVQRNLVSAAGRFGTPKQPRYSTKPVIVHPQLSASPREENGVSYEGRPFSAQLLTSSRAGPSKEPNSATLALFRNTKIEHHEAERGVQAAETTKLIKTEIPPISTNASPLLQGQQQQPLTVRLKPPEPSKSKKNYIVLQQGLRTSEECAKEKQIYTYQTRCRRITNMIQGQEAEELPPPRLSSVVQPVRQEQLHASPMNQSESRSSRTSEEPEEQAPSTSRNIEPARLSSSTDPIAPRRPWLVVSSNVINNGEDDGITIVEPSDYEDLAEELSELGTVTGRQRDRERKRLQSTKDSFPVKAEFVPPEEHGPYELYSSNEKLWLVKVIGSGRFSCVFHAYSDQSGKKALKFVHKNKWNDKRAKFFEQKAKKNKFVVIPSPFSEGEVASQDTVLVQMPLMDMSLQVLWEHHKAVFPQRLIMRLMAQVARAIKFVHLKLGKRRGKIEPKEFDVVITHVEESTDFDQAHLVKPFQPHGYRAPEFVCERPNLTIDELKLSDSWALGLLCAQLIWPLNITGFQFKDTIPSDDVAGRAARMLHYNYAFGKCERFPFWSDGIEKEIERIWKEHGSYKKVDCERVTLKVVSEKVDTSANEAWPFFKDIIHGTLEPRLEQRPSVADIITTFKHIE